MLQIFTNYTERWDFVVGVVTPVVQESTAEIDGCASVMTLPETGFKFVLWFCLICFYLWKVKVVFQQGWTSQQQQKVLLVQDACLLHLLTVHVLTPNDIQSCYSEAVVFWLHFSMFTEKITQKTPAGRCRSVCVTFIYIYHLNQWYSVCGLIFF